MSMKLLTVAGFVALGLNGCGSTPCEDTPELSTSCKKTVVVDEEVVVVEEEEEIVEIDNSVIGRTNTRITAYSFDPDTETLTVTGAGFDGFGDYSRFADIDKRGFTGFLNDRGQREYIGVYRASASGDLKAAIVGTPDYIGIADYIGVFSRSEGSAPTGGFADYSGDYIGYIFPIATGGIKLVEGDILVQFDFEQGLVEGLVYNRKAFATANSDTFTHQDLFVTQLPDVPANDLSALIMDRGTLSATGVYTGDSVRVSGTTNSVGSYAGTIGGVDDTATVGIDESTHETSGWLKISTNAEQEVGVFIATCDGSVDGTVCTP